MNELRLSAPKSLFSWLTRKSSTALVLAAVLAGSAPLFSSLAAPTAGPSSQTFPKLKLGERANFSRAIQLLGDRLPSVAQAYGISSASLHHLLLTDRTLHVDTDGRLHYIEEAPTAPATPQPQQALAPLTDTFSLHSKPGASKTIYLDFNGHVLTGTAWNVGTSDPINAPAWTTDADPSTFNDSERTSIQYIWQRVAEDFAPFDVDVTTELTSEGILTRSASSDTIYGVRVLISPISTAVGFPSSGGVSYVGMFSDVGDYYKTSLVFPERLGDSEKNIAEAASHEAGHALGLSHDGRISPAESYYAGQGTWAPIMGVGYSKSLVQWSKGEYTSANNTEDDLTIIASYLGYRADDHGNTASTATYLPTSTTISIAGIISSRSDTDVFGISSGAGNLILNIDPQSRSANLDILAELRDAAGNLVATSNPLGALNASFNLNVAAGTYFLSVRGTGEGDPATNGYSSYGSIGQYVVTGTVPSAGPQPPVAVASASPEVVPVGGTITFDGAGSFDPDGGTIRSYHWNFSDGSFADTASVVRALATPGTYSAQLSVTDDEGVTATTTIPYIVNQPPHAAFSTSPGTTGTAPFAVNFDASASSDPDVNDSIASYTWSFGDGTSASGVTVSKTFASAGTFTTTLTVTDSRGATSSTAVTLVISTNPNLVLKVSSITLTSTVNKTGSKMVQASVKVTNLSGVGVSGATVSGSWSGLVTGSSSATTGSTGIANLVSRSFKSTGTVAFKINSVSKTGYSYDATQSLTSKSGTF